MLSHIVTTIATIILVTFFVGTFQLMKRRNPGVSFPMKLWQGKVPFNKAILFLDITPPKWKDHITDIVYCALESAALFNPDRPVIHLHDSTRKGLKIGTVLKWQQMLF